VGNDVDFNRGLVDIDFSLLLITLSIFRSLSLECRRDLSLLTLSLLTSLDLSLQSLYSDLEVCARVASVVRVFRILRPFVD
jgi:hypothetical protein